MRRIAVILLVVAFAATMSAQKVALRADGVKVWGDHVVPLKIDQDVSKYGWDKLKEARLFYTQDGAQTWHEATGTTPQRTKKDNNRAEFRFSAPSNGLYGFFHVLKGRKAPDQNTKATSEVYVDTTAPTLSISQPSTGRYIMAGKALDIVYKFQDENLNRESGLRIVYSTDGGQNWTEIVSGGVVTGSYSWNHGLTDETDVWISIEVTDLVGNKKEAKVQQLRVGNGEKVRKEDLPSVSFSGPLYGKEKAEYGKIYFEKTDFYYTVDNRTGSPTEMVMLWYTIDGKNWVTGGVDTSGDANGKITVDFPKQMRRSELYGNFTQISFYYQVINQKGDANKEDPMSASPKDATFLVDTKGPHLGLLSPLPGAKLYKRKVPNNKDSGKLKISWAGADRNAIPYVTKPGHERGPVDIKWRNFGSAETNDWQVIAHSLPLKGTFLVENDLPAGKVEFMITATDQMGNQTKRISRPVEVIDATGYSKPIRGLAHLDSDRIWRKGVSFYRAGKYKDAIKQFDKALKLVPAKKKNALVHDKALAVYRTGRINDAIRSLNKIIGLEDTNMTYRFSLASIHYRSGHRDQARVQLLKIVPNDSKEPHVKARSMLASIENDRGNTTEAKKQWEFVGKHASKASDEYRDAQTQLKALKRKEAQKAQEEKKKGK